MPELPEVETVRRGVEAVHDLAGRTCLRIDRRSKYLLLRFSGDGMPSAIVHLGMTGRFLVDPIGARAARPEWRLHEHWRMDFGDQLVRFIDPRRFGMLDVARAETFATHKLLRGLGQEPLEEAFDGAFLFACKRGKKASVKSMLMDGRVLVGVGNIYASEACHRAHVRPRRAAGTLTLAECEALACAIRTVLASAIEAGGTSFRDYVGVGEEQGYFAQQLDVYEREGEPCRRCRSAIRRTTDAGRSTYWCAGCQR